jgi:glutathione S-transferase
LFRLALLVIAAEQCTLYGAPHSLYTGKARSYLRKQGIAYRELMPSHPTYVRDVAPTIGRMIIPVVVTRTGDIIQDTIDIIDHFEATGSRYPAYPSSPLQHVLAVIIEFYGNQSLLKHAMHYRWSFREQQAAFLQRAFSARAPEGAAEKIMARMHSYLPQLGVTEQTIPLIERSYEALLAILDQHFSAHPYVFGGHPTIADYGLIGPLFAHLGRDPVPANIMKQRAPNVFRWVERMNAPDLDSPEFPDRTSDLFEQDSIPKTLEPLLAHVAAEIFPELTDKLAFLDEWVAKHRPQDGEPVTEKPHQRRLGLVRTHFRGMPIEAGVEPYLVYVLRRVDRVLTALSADEIARVDAALASFGLLAARMGKRNYSVGRRNHIEVWEKCSESDRSLSSASPNAHQRQGKT